MSNHPTPPSRADEAAPGAVVPLVERLKRVAQLWADATGRSLGALATIVANHGSFFERLEAPGAGTTTATLEKFARFLTEACNWPEGAVPQEVCLFAHAVGVSGGACPASPDIAGDIIAQPVPEAAIRPFAGSSGRQAVSRGNPAAVQPAALDPSAASAPPDGAGAAGDGLARRAV